MTIKRILCSERIRHIPPQFSWVDQRLIRDRHIQRCDPAAAALYLFLVTVADAEGLSYYADNALSGHLSITAPQLAQARSDLLRSGLIAYQRPLYQVLALDPPVRVESPAPRDLSLEEIQLRLRQCHAAMGRAP
jgi:hypothetical protein